MNDMYGARRVRIESGWVNITIDTYATDFELEELYKAFAILKNLGAFINMEFIDFMNKLGYVAEIAEHKKVEVLKI